MAASAYCSSSIGAGSFSSTARPFGSQVRRGPYASQPACSATARPALWLTVGTLWGDRIEHILYRILPKSAGGLGQLDAPQLNPDYMVVMLGINNSWAAEDPVADSIFEGVHVALRALHARKPHSRIVLQSLLPTNDVAKNRDVVGIVNQRLVKLASSPEFSGFTRYLDLYPAFTDASGMQIPHYFTDGLHPNQVGYAVWRDQLLAFLKTERAASLRSTPTK